MDAILYVIRCFTNVNVQCSSQDNDQTCTHSLRINEELLLERSEIRMLRLILKKRVSLKEKRRNEDIQSALS